MVRIGIGRLPVAQGFAEPDKLGNHGIVLSTVTGSYKLVSPSNYAVRKV